MGDLAHAFDPECRVCGGQKDNPEHSAEAGETPPLSADELGKLLDRAAPGADYLAASLRGQFPMRTESAAAVSEAGALRELRHLLIPVEGRSIVLFPREQYERARALVAALSSPSGDASRKRDWAGPRWRKDGWPLCPFCGEDELFSLSVPSSAREINGCYRCNWRPYDPVDLIPPAEARVLAQEAARG